jgi:hypothetical protein
MVKMKRLIISEKTHRSLISALADLEIHLIMDNGSTDEVKRLLACVKAAKDIKVSK